MPQRRHRVEYDAEGNIVLSWESAESHAATSVKVPVTQERVTVTEQEEEPEREAWTVIPEPKRVKHKRIGWKRKEWSHKGHVLIQRAAADVGSHVNAMTRATRSAMSEGFRQYATSIAAGKPMLRETGSGVRRMFANVRDVLAQPVWVPTRNKNVKQYSRGTLFVLDVFRFGLTFGGIFLVLFVALNYQSFWQIGTSAMEQFLSGPSLDWDQGPGGDGTIVSAADIARRDGSVLSYLPTVGPPDNRIIIPKLKLNVPLVAPSYDALLRQDWAQVEVDIQDALQHGVVHYPGTAKPGQAGNFFVTGHSSYYPWAEGDYKTIFARLHELKVGDEYWVYYNGDRHRYVVRLKKEVLPSDITVLDQPTDKRMATLMTCTPIGTTLRRLILQAEEVDPDTGESLEVGERTDTGVTPKLEVEALPI